MRKNPEKILTQETCPDRDRTRARCVTGAHTTACPTAVDIFSALKYEHRCFIKIKILIGRGKNARQSHTTLLEACGRETLLYHTVVSWA